MASRNLGTLECDICHKQAQRHTGRQKLCGRLACKRTRDKIAWRTKTGQYRRASLLRHEAVIEALPPPLCGCGNKLLFSSDPMTGVSTEWCAMCGERPLQLYGRRPVVQHTIED